VIAPVEAAALVATAVAAVGLAAWMVPRPPRLARRVRPYTVAARTSLGRSADVLAVAEPGPVLSGGTLRRLVGPLVERAGATLGRLVRTDEALLTLRLQQAGVFPDVPRAQRAQEYRIRQLVHATAFAASFGVAGAVFGQGATVVLVLVGLGAFAGVSRWRGRVERSIEDRRRRMCVELYTINQLLALHVRVGGGVVQALQEVTRRGSGEVVSELASVLRRHRGGRPLAGALEQAATETPETNAARTYRLLANGVTYGADLAEGLRSLSEDIRDQRAEALKRAATRRRAAMLLPIIAILAPVMLLFIAAPLPSIVLGGR
jgi:Flp pilus assembly protein TadB